MMKEINLVDSNKVAQIKEIVISSIDYVRNHISVDDYSVILYFLTLKRNNLLSNIEDADQNTFKEYISYNISISDLDSHNKLFFENLSLFYEPTFNSLDIIRIKAIVKLYNDLDESLLELNFQDIFDTVLYYIVTIQGKNFGGSILPVELSKFICSLSNFTENGEVNKQNPATPLVYNPFAGYNSLNVFLPKKCYTISQEINSKMSAVASLRKTAYNREFNYEETDSINNWHFNFLNDNEFEINDNQYDRIKFDLIISDPPKGAKLVFPQVGMFGSINNYEHFLIEKGLDSLKVDGKIIALLSASFLFRIGIEERLRKHLVELDLIDTIISLPGGILSNTNIQTVILVINKNKSSKGVIRLIKADQFIESDNSRIKVLNYASLTESTKVGIESDSLRFVSNEIVALNDYNLTVARYFQKEYPGKPIGEFCSELIGTRISTAGVGKYVRLRDLKEDKLEFNLTTEEIEESEYPRTVKFIEESCILVSLRWKTLKPTFFNYTGCGIYISNDILALKLNESIADVGYFINELISNDVTDQLNAIRVGATIPNIHKRDFFQVKIVLPENIEDQKAIFRKIAEALAEKKKEDLLSFSKFHGLEKEMYEQNTFLRHTLAGPASNLISSLVNIKTILKEQVIALSPGIMSLKVSENHLNTFEDYLNIIERDILKISTTVKRQLKVDNNISSKLLTPIDLMHFLDKFVKEQKENSSLNYNISFSFDMPDLKELYQEDDMKIKVLANEDLLFDMLNNIIENAVRHAFGNDMSNTIDVELSIVNGTYKNLSPKAKISVSNSGKPISEDFTLEDFIRKGSTMGVNSGEGFGGWYINEIVKHFNGTLNLERLEKENSNKLVTSFEVIINITD